jgi:hypothetical protein
MTHNVKPTEADRRAAEAFANHEDAMRGMYYQTAGGSLSIYSQCVNVDLLAAHIAAARAAGAAEEREAHIKTKRALNDFVELCKTWGCTVGKNSIVGRPKFCVLDVDGEILTEGNSPEEAARKAIQWIENRE